MKLTDIAAPDYFHKVVDCQWACPAHTPVPEYIRLIAAGRYGDAYMVNWKSNVFPGDPRAHLRPPLRAGLPARARREGAGRDLPPEARRRRLQGRHPRPPAEACRRKNGKRIALVGAGPASLTVARDLAPLGYECVVFDGDPKSGGMMRSQIPRFRLPETVIDEECNYILDLGVEFRGGRPHRQPEGAAGRRLGRGVRRLRRAARARARYSRAARKPPRTSTSASTGSRRSRSATSTRSASA